MSNMNSIVVKNEKETESFASQFSKNLISGDVICLYGELGAGKTTFTRYLVSSLGFEDRVMSPTFTIVRKYTKNAKAKFSINHIDLYRLDSEESVRDIGLDEITGAESITLVEWPEKLGKIIPEKRYDIFFKVTGENERLIEYKKNE